MEGNEAKAEEILLPTKVFYHFWINEEDPKIAKMCPNPEWKHPLGNFFFTNFQYPCELKKFYYKVQSTTHTDNLRKNLVLPECGEKTQELLNE